MRKVIFALAATAVAVSAVPANARTYSNTIACSGWRDGQCVAWNRLTAKQAHDIKVGYQFGPNYSYYSDVNTLPPNVVTQYHLAPTNKYVSADGYVFVVDPNNYAVTQVIAPTP